MIKTVKQTALSSIIALSLIFASPYAAPAAVFQKDPTSVKSSAEVLTQPVSISQWRPGSLLATLQWTPNASASSYRIYKTGTIRPTWRLFAIMPGAAVSRTVADRPGAIAIYRVMAVINSREVLVGEVIYQPVR
jgi:hypothetical protein